MPTATFNSQAFTLPKGSKPILAEVKEYSRYTSNNFEEVAFISGSRDKGLVSLIAFNKHTSPAYLHLYDVFCYEKPQQVSSVTLLTNTVEATGDALPDDPTQFYLFFMDEETGLVIPDNLGLKVRFSVAGTAADDVVIKNMTIGRDFYMRRLPTRDDAVGTNINGRIWILHRTLQDAINNVNPVTNSDDTLNSSVTIQIISGWIEYPPIMVPAGSNTSLDFGYPRKFTNGLQIVASLTKDSYTAFGNHMFYDCILV